MHRHLRQDERDRHGPQDGFSLIEVVLSVAILAILLLGMQSAMLLASRSTPGRSSATGAALRAAQAIDQVAADLACATAMVTMSDKTIELVVGDRNADSLPETIRYSWSGIPGEPLMRKVNQGKDVAIAEDVREFSLVYRKRQQLRPTAYIESGETLLCSNEVSTQLSDFVIDSTNFAGQYFKPVLPDKATNWRVTRLKLKAKVRGSSVGEARIQLRTAHDMLPGSILDEVVMFEKDLSNQYTWREFTFSIASGLPVDAGLCMTIQWSKDNHACEVQYQASGASIANGQFIKSSNSGTTWTTPVGQCLICYVYGTYTTPASVQYDYRLSGVECVLMCGSEATGRLRSTLRPMSEPQVN